MRKLILTTSILITFMAACVDDPRKPKQDSSPTPTPTVERKPVVRKAARKEARIEPAEKPHMFSCEENEH
jgi:hypothetical protein